jgi:cell division protein FtsW
MFRGEGMFSWSTTWWRGIDKPILFSLLLLSVLGCLLIVSASISLEAKNNWTPFLFFQRHIFYLMISWGVLVFFSFLNPRQILVWSLGIFLLTLCALVFVMFWGQVIKGGRRWIQLGPFSLQPSEFLKPVLCILMAWILSKKEYLGEKKAYLYGLMVLVVPLCMVFKQPDFGMSFLIFQTGITQMFLAGLPFVWILCLVGVLMLIGLSAFWLLPHVTERVSMFLGKQEVDALGKGYQSIQSAKAFVQGGLWGKGTGGGKIIDHLPDGQSDFIFAVAGEELGFLFCIGILILYGIIFTQTFLFAAQVEDVFLPLSCVGLILSMVYQVLINVSSTLQLIPTKGMTLPFLSYGGSSLLSGAMGMGMLLGLMAYGRRNMIP